MDSEVSAEEQLFQATTAGNAAAVARLLRLPHLNVNWGEEYYDRTALIRACFKGHADIVRMLLADPRVDVNRAQNQGATPLNIACQYQQLEVVKLLLADPRVDVNIPNDRLGTPFFYACNKMNLEIVRAMVAHPRLNVNQATETSITPFMAVCEGDSEELKMELFQVPSLDLEAANLKGETALHICMLNPDPPTRFTELLINHPAVDVNHLAVRGMTPVFAAARAGNFKCLQLLIASGKDLDLNVGWFNAKPRLSLKVKDLLDRYQENKPRTVFQERLGLDATGSFPFPSLCVFSS